jgi:hypothetical protein
MMIFNLNAPCDKEKKWKFFWTLNLNSEGSKQRQCKYTLAFHSKAVFAFSEESKHIKCRYTFDFLEKSKHLQLAFLGYSQSLWTRISSDCFLTKKEKLESISMKNFLQNNFLRNEQFPFGIFQQLSINSAHCINRGNLISDNQNFLKNTSNYTIYFSAYFNLHYFRSCDTIKAQDFQ